MVSGAAATDAVERARLLPGLRVGLHLVLVEGRPTLPPERLPDLVNGSGRFRSDMAGLGFDIFARAAVRRQLTAEIEAQFAAFRATGLPLDHVNAHKHFHLHPTIARMIMAIGCRQGMRGLRVPLEPRAILSQAEPRTARRSTWLAAPWAKLLAGATRRAGLRCPDAVFGLGWSGAMTPTRLAAPLHHLPAGRTEIYLHPATTNDFAEHTPGYRYVEELAALQSPAAMSAVRRPDISLGGYAGF